MTNEEKITILEEENEELKKRLDLLEFKFELLFDNSDSCRYFIEREFTRKQYEDVMNLMDEIRNRLFEKEEVSYMEYENRISQIRKDLDYHDAEIIAKLLMEEGRWEEVFPALYGESMKYKSYLARRKQGGTVVAN